MEAVLAFVAMYLVGRHYVERRDSDPMNFEPWVAWGEGYNAGWGDSLAGKPLDLSALDPIDYKPEYLSDQAFACFKDGYLAGWSDQNGGRTFYSTPNPYNIPSAEKVA